MRKIFFYSLLIVVISWFFGFIHFINLVFGYSNPDAKINTEAIVVFTGGKNRIETGIKLLKTNPSKRLFITGVDSKIKKIIDVLKIFSSLPIVLQGKIDIGQKATTTFENVLEVKEWLDSHQIKSITLVTSAYHLPRSLLVAENELPGISFEGYPVFLNGFKITEWWKGTKNITLFLKEYSKYSVVVMKIYINKYTKEFYEKLAASS